MTFAHAVLLAAAGLAAGAINSVAGGGSLVSFPALLAAGYPTLTANATNLIAVTPGYVGGTVGYRSELGGQATRARLLGSIVVAGAFTGSAILLLAPASAFRRCMSSSTKTASSASSMIPSPAPKYPP